MDASSIVKNQEWEKKKARSKEIEANRRIRLAARVGITQAKDGSSQLADLELEYTMALNRRKRLKEEHATLIQGELLKMEEELQAKEVFRAFREVFEEQKDALDRRYRTVLREAIQDAIYLSARNQQLEAENAQLHDALAELRDALSVKKVPGGSQRRQQDTAAT
ncbi:hypothetical protein EOD39_18272 [Acipenser ruthenus]|uniref:Uncharacterized protein n=1 Tax=Acipenser ruthenus TaxID=7906 RepID=A0A444V170_ACIRT|nr:hypothetical protein EOD39_18272 [Acipenser ruthenus]